MKQIWMRQSIFPAAALVALTLNAGVCHADELTEKILRTFRTQSSESGPVWSVTAKSDNELQLIGRRGTQTVYLFNVRKACEASQERCEAEVSSFVQGTLSVASADPSSGAFAPEKVYAVLRKAGFSERASQAIKEPNKQLVTLPFVDGIELLFVVDGERAVRYVNRDDMNSAGLTESTLFDLASSNSARLPRVDREPVKGMPGLYFMPAKDGLGSSRAFDVNLWNQLEEAEGAALALAVPTRDWIL